MSATAPAPAATAEAEDVPRSRRRLVVLAGVLVLLLAAGGGWWALGPAASASEAEPADGEIVELAPLTTTVGERGIQHARVALAVVLAEGEATEQVTARQALLQDALLREVAAMDADTVRSAEGSDALRKRLSAKARDIWGDEVVRRVVLTELMVQ